MLRFRSIRYWTPQYIINRIPEKIYQISRPDHPWLTKSTNSILSSYLKDSDVGLEFGAGRSTIWLAKRLSFLTSIEHDKAWYMKVQNSLKINQINNVDHFLIEKEAYDEEDGKNAKYVQFIKEFKDFSLDFVLVDGIYRSACATGAIEKIRHGGMLIIDNANWFLPSASSSPDSRTFEQGPASKIWSQFYEAVRSWRRIWTSSGIHDTVLYFKPC